MTRDEALLMRMAMEQSGWVDMRVTMSSVTGRTVYGVSGVNPLTGIRSPWYWQYENDESRSTPAPASTRLWLA